MRAQKSCLCDYRDLIKHTDRLRIRLLELMLTVRIRSVGQWIKGLPIAVGGPFPFLGSSHLRVLPLNCLKFVDQVREPLQQPFRKPWDPFIWN